MDLYSFFPDQGRAAWVDRRMHRELADSLAHIRQQIQAQPDLAATLPMHHLDAAICFIESDHKVSPLLFAQYYQLVFAIIDNEADLQTRLKALADAMCLSKRLEIRDLSARELGSEEATNLYRQCFDSDEGITYGFLPPDPEQSHKARESIERAMILMEQIIPALYQEIHTIIAEILLAAAPKDPDAFRFDGASSYQLWGAVTLNTDEEKSDISMLEALAHECAHCLLFGLTIEEPLVLNDDQERYHSPLRADPRPMDGIYHATFVSARMHYAMQQAQDSPVLTAGQQQECRSNMQASRKAFSDGHAVLSEHARYSETGLKIMQNAAEYMQQFPDSEDKH